MISMLQRCCCAFHSKNQHLSFQNRYDATPTRSQTVRTQPTALGVPARPSPSLRGVPGSGGAGPGRGVSASPAARASPRAHRASPPAPTSAPRYVGNGSAGGGGPIPVRQPSTEEYFPIWDSETGQGGIVGQSPLDKVSIRPFAF